MMSTNDYIKYITQQLVRYFQVPKAERKERREQKREEKTDLSFRLFGFIPFALKMFFRK